MMLEDGARQASPKRGLLNDSDEPPFRFRSIAQAGLQLALDGPYV